MNLEMILGVVTKGLSVIEALSEASKDIAPGLDALKAFTQKGSDITEADVEKTEKALDAELDALEEPMEREHDQA